MADVRIPIHLDLGDLGRLADVRREVEATRRVAAETQAQEQAERRRRELPGRRVPGPPPPPPPPGTTEWETLPGGGIRRKGYQEQPATTPALNDYVQMPDGRLVKKGWEGRVTPGTGVTPPPLAQQAQQTQQAATTQTQQNTKALGQVGTSAGRLSEHLQQLNTTLKQEPAEGRRPLSGRALELLGAGAQLRPGQVRTPSSSEDTQTGLSPGQRFAARTALGLGAMVLGAGGGSGGMLAGGLRTGISAGIGAAALGGPVAGVIAGTVVTAIATATEAAAKAMEIYQQRARGVIAVGSLLSQNFDQVGESISMLRRDYQILNTESPQAMEALGRITGELDPATLRGIGRYAMAYGQDPVRAAQQTGLLQRLAPGGGGQPLALAGRVAGDLGQRPYRPMPLPAQASEVERLAQTGAALGGQAPLSLYARQTALFGGMGEELQVPGGPSGRAERFYQGITQAPNEAVYALRVEAVERLRRKQGNLLTVGRRTFDLSKTFDREVVMSIAHQIPQLQEEYMGGVRQLAGGREELIPRATHEIIGGEQMTLLQTWDLTQAERRRPGVLGRTGRPFTPEEEAQQRADDDERLERRRARLENRPQEIAARMEEMLEPVGEKAVQALTGFEGKVLDVVEALRRGATGADTFTVALDGLTAKLKELVDLLFNPAVGPPVPGLYTPGAPQTVLPGLSIPLPSGMPGGGYYSPGTPQTYLPTTPQKPAR